MDTPDGHLDRVSPDEPEGRPVRGRGALGFAGVLLLVLALTVLGSRGEITQSWGLAGEEGTFTATSCGRDIVSGTGETARAMCDGTFAPDSGATPYDAVLHHDGDPGEAYRGRADDDGVVYRTDWATRWASVSLPMIPLGLLWVTPGVWLAMRRPGPMSRPQVAGFLGLWAAPAALVVLLGAVGLLVGILTS